LIVICPYLTKYSQDLEYMITNAPNNIRIYEIGRHATNKYLMAKTRDYQKQFDDAIAIPEDLYVGGSIQSGNLNKATLERFFLDEVA